MQGNYDIVLSIASYCVAVAAAYAALDLGGRIAFFEGRRRWFWLVAGAGAMGTGIWSVSFISLKARLLPGALVVDPTITALAWLAAFAASLLALQVIASNPLTRRSAVVGGVLMGLGIGNMSVSGMAALGLAIQYDYALFALSVVVAMLVASASLFIALRLHRLTDSLVGWGRLGSAMIMALAICGPHYLAAGTAQVPADTAIAASGALTLAWMGMPLALLSGLLLASTLGLSILDTRLVSERRRVIRLRAEAERIHRLACYDSATGLPNRNLFTEKLLKQLVTAHNSDDTATVPVGLVYAELRNYRALVEAQGSERMNRILKALAVKLSRQLQPGDLLARLSSDGLILMIREQDSRSTQAALSAFCAQLSTPLHDEGEAFRFNWGIGSSRYPDHGNSSQSLIRAAMAIERQIGAEAATLAVSATPRYALAS